MIQYRKNTNSSWDNLTLDDGLNDFYNVFQEGIISGRTIDNLEYGHIYQFRTILLDEALETHDPSLTEPFEIELCEGETLKVKNKANTSIDLLWGPETEEEPTVCHTKGYTLEISQIENDYLEKERVITTVKNSYEVKNLNPGQTYHIQLKKLINDNESVPISSINVTTDKVSTFMGVTISKNESAVHIEWFESPIYTTYYVKYMLKKYLPCKKQEISSPLHVATTSDIFYDLEMKDLESNALYELFVTADINANINPQNKSFTTTLNKTSWKCNSF
uniref:Fibronectin type-III domain-containing protein n=1 Tax=Cacopsylla melanoneura TaxID=428564 RepID=A0A8D8WHZ5_9HEMI